MSPPDPTDRKYVRRESPPEMVQPLRTETMRQRVIESLIRCPDSRDEERA